MPSPESSCQRPKERSASFNSPDFSKLMRTKIISANSSELVESAENRIVGNYASCHVHYSSLDSLHSNALHPINLNAKLDQLPSSLRPARLSVKAFVADEVDVTGQQFLSPGDQKVKGTVNGGEAEAETQEELILDPDEVFFHDAQEESVSTSASAESKSPREDLDFVLWGNATFCPSETKKLPICDSELKLQMQTPLGCEKRIHSKQGLPSAGDNNLYSLSKEHSPHISSSQMSSLLPKNVHNGHEETFKCDSSVGSTSSFQNTSLKARDWTESPLHDRSITSEAHSCCLDFDHQHVEILNDRRMTGHKLQITECSSKRVSKGTNSGDEVAICSQTAVQMRGCPSPEYSKEGLQDISIASDASEEVKIRAELELEIEKDLEEEIRSKINVLNRRLQELQTLKATRHPREEQSRNEQKLCPLMTPRIHRQRTSRVSVDINEVQSPKSRVSKSKPPKSSGYQDEGMILNVNLTSSRELSGAEKDAINRNLCAGLRKFAMSSRGKDGSLRPPLSDGGRRNVKTSKSSVEGLPTARKPSVEGESSIQLQQDHQIRTVNPKPKRFDWAGSLRSDVTSCTPPPFSMKNNGEETRSSMYPKEPLDGTVARALFTEDGSTPAEKTSTRQGLITPATGISKTFGLSTTKFHNEPVASTPRARSTRLGLSSLISENTKTPASVKKLANQKLSVGVDVTPHLPRTLVSRQKSVSTSSASRPTSEPRALAKQSKIERGTAMLPQSSTSRPPKRTPSTPLGKVKEPANAASSSSKDSKSTPTKSPSQGREIRVSPSQKSVTSSTPATKGKITSPSDSVGKKTTASFSKPVASYSKATAASSAKRVWH
ncbi:hypothetical protein KP509_13G002900 [Ceratopteris richardii]|uniref:Uncharacterized protein n=1 Tax=Ceratopteris richardii TaxID=49495 RepID=A0A8T2TAW8_CERRI|nr:hypothetical protein KP509_13G002900 [Ceratopteris richardii]